MVEIGSNISALKAQRQLARTSESLSSTFERLASGQRINHASDDAAGLAVALSLNNDVRVYGQAIRNANDGVSTLNIASGAIDQLSSIVVRLKELAEQSANGSYSSSQRQALNTEAQNLKLEYQRVVSTTQFNGIKLLDGTINGARIQLGLTGGTSEALALDIENIGVRGRIGDGTFQGSVTYSSASAIFNLETADFNNDGFADIVSSDFSSGSASIFLGNGDGTFKARNIVIVAGNQYGILTGDFNQDGKEDVVIGAGKVALGNGDGTFLAFTAYDVPVNATNLSRGDFNGDGYLDLASADEISGNSVSILLGNGNGTFKAKTSFASGVRPEDLFAADFNGDGRTDIVTTNLNDNNITILIGNGNGSFAAPISYGASLGNNYKLTGADVNNDGKIDIVTTGGPNAWVFLGNSNGSFQAPKSFAGGAVPYSVSVADINGDSLGDLVLSDYSSAFGVKTLLGNGDGTFKAFTSYASSGNGYGLVVGDWDSDGVTDIAASTNTNPALNIYMGNGTGAYGGVELGFSLLTQAGSQSALETFSNALTTLSSRQGKIGAQQSRLQTALQSIGSARNADSESYSRIVDADIAQDTATLTQSQVLQQAATAVLAQAQVEPQLALLLLRG